MMRSKRYSAADQKNNNGASVAMIKDESTTPGISSQVSPAQNAVRASNARFAAANKNAAAPK